MTDASGGAPTSDRLKAFSVVMEDSNTDSDAAQALISHIKAEEHEQRESREERERWRRWWQQSLCAGFETKDDDALFRQCQELTDVWKDFGKKSIIKRALQRTDVSLGDEFHPPAIDTLHHVVHELGKGRMERSQTTWGKIKANALAFADTLNGHKALFSIFPSENIYTSVLSGTVSTIVLACANQKKIGEGFTHGLRQIGDNLAYLSLSKHILNTSHVRKAVCDAYVEVFKFLCYFMRWEMSRWNRLSSSVQGSFYNDHIKAHIDEIERLAVRVDREINRQTGEGVNQLLELGTTLGSVDISKTNADKFRRKDISDRKPAFDQASRAFSQLGYDVTHSLTATEQQHDYDILMLAVRRSDQSEDSTRGSRDLVAPNSSKTRAPSAAANLNYECSLESSDEGEETNDCRPGLNHYARAEIESFAACLKPYVNNGVIEAANFARQDSGTSVPSEVVSDIQKWLKGNTSSSLWIEGPVFPCDLSPTAIRVLAVVNGAGIPAVSFFDQQRYPNQHKLDFKEAGVVCLLYTLLSQVILQLPSVIETEETLDDVYFARLDGSWGSIAHALSALRLLLSFTLPSMVLVVHGLDAIDGRTTRKVLKQLIDVVREQSSRTVVKCLFTTNGMSQSLGDNTSMCERVDASLMVQDRPGRPLPGAGSLSNLDIHSSGKGAIADEGPASEGL